MKKCFLTILSCLTVMFSFTQQNKETWFFGNQLGVSFNNGTPSWIQGGKTSAREGSVVLNDHNGDPIFYFDSKSLYNAKRNHELVESGFLRNDNFGSSAQHAIVEDPANQDEYFLIYTLSKSFTGEVNRQRNNIRNSEGRRLDIPVLYAKIKVDQSEVTVLDKNIEMPLPKDEFGNSLESNLDNWNEQVAIVPDCEQGFWIVLGTVTDFHIYHLGFDGVIEYENSHYHGLGTSGNAFNNKLKVSPNGQYIALAKHSTGNVPISSNLGFLKLFEFNKITGEFINSKNIDLNTINPSSWRYSMGCSFDNESKYLYGKLGNEIYQYDIETENIKVVSTGVNLSMFNEVFNDFRLASNGDIYFSGRKTTLGAILNASSNTPTVVTDAFPMNISNWNTGDVEFGLPDFIDARRYELNIEHNEYNYDVSLGETISVDLYGLHNELGIHEEWEVKWYEDELMQTEVTDPSEIVLSSDKEFFALVNNKSNCPYLEQVKFNLIFLPEVQNITLDFCPTVDGNVRINLLGLRSLVDKTPDLTTSSINWYSETPLDIFSEITTNLDNHITDKDEVYFKVTTSNGRFAIGKVIINRTQIPGLNHNQSIVICPSNESDPFDLKDYEHLFYTGTKDVSFEWYGMSNLSGKINNTAILLDQDRKVYGLVRVEGYENCESIVEFSIDVETGFQSYTKQLCQFPDDNEEVHVNLNDYLNTMNPEDHQDYSWFTSDGNEIANHSEVYISNSSVFFLDITNEENTCASRAKLTLTLRPPPTLHELSYESCANIGEDFALFDLKSQETIIGQGVSGLTYEWFEDIECTIPITNPSNYSSTPKDVFLRAYNFDPECNSIAKIQLIVDELEPIELHSLNACETENGKGQFDLVGLNINQFDVEWFEDNQFTQLITESPFVSESRLIYLRYRDIKCSIIVEKEVELTVLERPIVNNYDEVICANTSDNVTVLLSSREGQIKDNPNYTIEWFSDIEGTQRITTDEQTLHPGENIFYAFISNRTDCSSISQVLFIVSTLPEITPISHEIDYCAEQEGVGVFDLITKFEESNPDISLNNVSFRDESGQVINQPSAYSSIDGESIQVRVYNQLGCFNEGEMHLSLITNEVEDLPINLLIEDDCSEDGGLKGKATLDIDASDLSEVEISWSNTNHSHHINENLDAGDYTVTIIDKRSCDYIEYLLSYTIRGQEPDCKTHVYGWDKSSFDVAHENFSMSKSEVYSEFGGNESTPIVINDDTNFESYSTAEGQVVLLPGFSTNFTKDGSYLIDTLSCEKACNFDCESLEINHYPIAYQGFSTNVGEVFSYELSYRIPNGVSLNGIPYTVYMQDMSSGDIFDVSSGLMYDGMSGNNKVAIVEGQVSYHVFQNQGYDVNGYEQEDKDLITNSFRAFVLVDDNTGNKEVDEWYEFCDIEVPLKLGRYFNRSINPDQNGELQNNLDSEHEISIYPNPSSGIVNISIGNQEDHQVVIKDALGRVLVSREIRSNEIIDLSQYATGVYYIWIGNENYQKTERLIIAN